MKIVLDNIRSALNVGSIFRSCDAFGAEELILCGITATPPSRELHKTALGAEISVAFRYFEETTVAIEELKNEGYTIVAVEQTPVSILLQNYAENPNQKYVYVMGNEVDGVSQAVLEMCDMAVEIPQVGTKKSLNVSVAAGVVMWQSIEIKLIK